MCAVGICMDWTGLKPQKSICLKTEIQIDLYHPNIPTPPLMPNVMICVYQTQHSNTQK
jgi:hypothetical protein